MTFGLSIIKIEEGKKKKNKQEKENELRIMLEDLLTWTGRHAAIFLSMLRI